MAVRHAVLLKVEVKGRYDKGMIDGPIGNQRWNMTEWHQLDLYIFIRVEREGPGLADIFDKVGMTVIAEDSGIRIYRSEKCRTIACVTGLLDQFSQRGLPGVRFLNEPARYFNPGNGLSGGQVRGERHDIDPVWRLYGVKLL